MNYHIMTLFPEMMDACFNESIIGRARSAGLININLVNIRDFAAPERKRRVDDYPFGGGAGMVMQAEPIDRAYAHIKESIPGSHRVIYVTPSGRVFDQKLARELASEDDIVFLCGHYEGVDERILQKIVTDNVSIGDYVLTGGELPVMVMVDAISRNFPGVLSNDESGVEESFSEDAEYPGGLLEYPQYTRPAVYEGMPVPEVLLSGNHALIAKWRREKSIERTRERRPDLLYKE
ncbi:MAG: tRNA (guanosine(37)-N1)-methyltransferase TrmD [Lachnospiraceae bacterium]|nr:tRNA (guanosine(37)-N1)-methyltransferase TrmD [Lachnospiraceae bacterium]